MLREVVEVDVLPGFKLRLRFDDGHVGVVDLSGRVGSGPVFEPLREPGYFGRVRVDPELGTIVWPNGADLCPDVLYAEAGGNPASGTDGARSAAR